MTTRNRNLLAGFCIALITIAVYLPATKFSFLTYDDQEYVTQNSMVYAGLTWDGLKWALTTHHAGNWHPLTWLSHMADAQLFGLNPGFHHLTNILLHACNSVLLFVFLHLCTKAFWRSVLAALIFSLHPLHVESVAWVAERKDVLSAFFFLGTLLLYRRYALLRPVQAGAPKQSGRPSFVWLAGSATTFALGLMSKPMLVTLPLVLLLLDFWPLARFNSTFSNWKPLLLEKLPFFGLSAVSCFLTLTAQSEGGAVSSLGGLSIPARFENAIASYTKYVAKAIWPGDLAVFYPHPGLHYPESIQWPLPVIALALVALATISVGCILARKRSPWLAVGWFWFLLMLVPVIGIVQAGAQAMADRYMYIPLIGLEFAIIWTAQEYLQRLSKGTLAPAFAFAVPIAYFFATAHQLQFWTDDLTLFSHCAAVTKDNSVAHYSVALALQQKNEDALAIPEFSRALQFAPWDVQTRTSLALSLSRTGNTNEALQELDNVLTAAPGHLFARLTFADVLMKCGQTNRALEEFSQLVAKQPNSDFLHYRYAVALTESTRLSEAQEQYVEALRLNPNLVQARTELARLLTASGKFAEAEAELRLVLAKQETADLHFQIGVIAEMQRQGSAAAAHYSRALELNANFVPALNELAWLLATSPDSALRDGARAVKLAEHARDLTEGKQASIWGTLAAAYAEAGNFPEALKAATNAIEVANSSAAADVAATNTKLLQEYRNGHPHRE